MQKRDGIWMSSRLTTMMGALTHEPCEAAAKDTQADVNGRKADRQPRQCIIHPTNQPSDSEILDPRDIPAPTLRALHSKCE